MLDTELSSRIQKIYKKKDAKKKEEGKEKLVAFYLGSIEAKNDIDMFWFA